jgi:hypothetical protein
VESGFAIGLGTAVLVLVIAALLLRGRFGRREMRDGKGDPAAVWLRGERSETPLERDTATAARADDPTGPDAEGTDSDGGGGSDGP